MASAEDFFARIRARISQRGKEALAAPSLRPLPSAPPPTRERFFEELTRIGAIPRATDRAGARASVLEIARKVGAERYVAWRDGLVAELGIPQALTEAGLLRVDDELAARTDRVRLEQAGLVVSGCDAAFAENGALLMRSAATRGRLLTALPRIHVALVGRSQLVAGLDDLPAALREKGLPSAAVLHTGPTFSGDIEAIVVVGAHGPAELHVVWIDDA